MGYILVVDKYCYPHKWYSYLYSYNSEAEVVDKCQALDMYRVQDDLYHILAHKLLMEILR
jgi:hypothetical protein